MPGLLLPFYLSPSLLACSPFTWTGYSMDGRRAGLDASGPGGWETGGGSLGDRLAGGLGACWGASSPSVPVLAVVLLLGVLAVSVSPSLAPSSSGRGAGLGWGAGRWTWLPGAWAGYDLGQVGRVRWRWAWPQAIRKEVAIYTKSCNKLCMI